MTDIGFNAVNLYICKHPNSQSPLPGCILSILAITTALSLFFLVTAVSFIVLSL
jgi:hypothetical protein